MLKQERQAYILRQVNLHNKVLSTDLSQSMEVSDDTIRRDLQELAEAGKLIKVHGGALSPSFHAGVAHNGNVYSWTEKQQIARKALTLIKDGMTILTSGGTTILELARALPPDLKATFISGSIPVLFEYMNHPNIEVIAIGDRISKNSKVCVGMNALSRIRSFRPDLCFMGVNAIDLGHGISDNDYEVVQMKAAMVETTSKLVCLTISEKINSRQPFSVCGLDSIDTLITELPPDDPLLQPYREAGIRVL